MKYEAKLLIDTVGERLGLTIGSGKIWFTELAGDRVGRILINSPHTITVFPVAASTDASVFQLASHQG